MKKYVRLKIKGTRKIFWAEEIQKNKLYREVDKHGVWGNNGKEHYILIAQEDIEYSKSAEMNLHYGQLEIKKEN